jgi:hypothetical protein
MTNEVDGRSRELVVLRVPPWQTALVLIVASAFAALAIYSGIDGRARLACIVLALATAAAGIVSARSYCVADQVGIGVRRVVSEHAMTWAEITSVDVIVRKNQPAIYVFGDGVKPLRVPSYLTLPLKPTTGLVATRRLEGLALRIGQLRPGS